MAFHCGFPCVCWPFIYLLCKNFYSSSLLIFELFVLLLLSSRSSLDILDINLLLDNTILKYFLPFCRLLFHPLDSVLGCAKVFNFDEV